MSIAVADIQNRMQSQDFLNIFDVANTGSYNATFTQQCIDDAQSEVDMALYAAFGGTLDSYSGALDNAIKRVVVVLSIRNGLQLNPLMTDAQAAPYKMAIGWAEKWIDRMVRGDRARPVTKQAPIAEPVGEVTGTLDDAGATTSPYRAGADGDTNTGF